MNADEEDDEQQTAEESDSQPASDSSPQMKLRDLRTEKDPMGAGTNAVVPNE
ncbi:MAG TPA: hypothetical protein VGC85_05920 [Chthoniobacterales bacterium]